MHLDLILVRQLRLALLQEWQSEQPSLRLDITNNKGRFMMNRSQKGRSLLAAALLLTSTAILAKDSTAVEIAKKAYDYLDTQTKYAFDAVNISHVGESTTKGHISAKVNRPNQLRLDIQAEHRNRSNYLDNGAFTVYDHDKNMYLRLKTPKDIDGALDSIYDRFQIKIPLAQLLYQHMGNRMKSGYTAKNFGVVELDGEKCNYLAFADKYKEIQSGLLPERSL